MNSSENVGNRDECNITLPERFDFSCVREFREKYESMTNRENKTLYLDFYGTRHIDSSALGMMINAKKYFEKQGVKIKIRNANEGVKKILHIANFEKLFDII